jgi:thiosulfate reductase cytochrome b subunit
MSTRQVLIFTRFERFWHWTQMVLIVALLVTGFGVHGFHRLFDFGDAVTAHTVAALALGVLWIFAIFWHLTTGTWRHYVPTAKGLWPVARFYAWGIFQGEGHPYRKAYWRKHNPLQALSYLGLKLFLFPAIWVSGIAYLLFGLWRGVPHASQWLGWVALVHSAAAYLILVFIIAHLYLLTTGHSFVGHVKPMFTGFDEVDLTPEEEAYLAKDQPGHIR